MRLVYFYSTEADLAWFRTYYGSMFSGGTNQAARRYLKAIDNLISNPYIGRPAGQDDLRRLTIPKTPFSVFYRIIEDRIEIVRIWDQRADPKRLEFHEEAAVIA